MQSYVKPCIKYDKLMIEMCDDKIDYPSIEDKPNNTQYYKEYELLSLFSFI